MAKNDHNQQQPETAKILNFLPALKAKEEKKVYERWCAYYHELPYQELLDSLVYQHENDFPLRKSDKVTERTQHKALVDVLTEKAQSSFLRELLQEINAMN